MGKELHIGAGLLILAATCGRVAMKNGDVLVRNSDVVVQGARHLDDVGAARHLDGLRHADGMRHADGLRHADAAAQAHPIDELLGDVALEGAQLTAEHLLEWQEELGEPEEDDLSGVWVYRGQLEGEITFERMCVLSEEGETYAGRCEEVGSIGGRQAYRARWNHRLAVGQDSACALVERVHLASIDVEGDIATGVAAHLRDLLKNERACSERALLGEQR